jgi:hypothetical protein
MILSVLFALTAHAGNLGGSSSARTPEQEAAELDRLEAEHVRLSDDLETFAERQLWPAVERNFQEIQRRGIPPTKGDLVHAAMAARARGEMLATYDRLKAAAALDPSKDVMQLLAAIDQGYGLVELIAHGAKDVGLEAAEMPFEPDMRLAVESAIGAVGRGGSFRGLLPRGAYTFAGQAFEVEPGLSVRIEVSPKLKKTDGQRVDVTTMPLPGATP